jgi:hypothetical protein
MTAASRSYQAIPDAVEEAMENGGSELAPLTTRKNEDSTSHAEALPSSATALVSKLSYIALGLVIGYFSSESGRRSLWNPTVKINISDAEEESPWFVKRHQRDEYDVDGLSIHNGKSFSHALPFEDAFPGIQAWADTLPSFLTEESKLLSSSSSPFSSFFLLGAAAPTSINNNKDSTSVAAPHLLYLVHPLAVTLLGDASKSVSEYSLDYFLMNSGGFDAQINQAYCGVVRIRHITFNLHLLFNAKLWLTHDIRHLTRLFYLCTRHLFQHY